MSENNYHVSVTQQLVFAFKDTVVMTKRNVLRNYRLPQLIFFSTIQPIIFLLLFNYVFGGAVSQGNGSAYINFLLPGILVQTTLFGSIQTGVGLAEDLQKGVVDRFRSLPMSRIAHVAGRVFADTMRNIISSATDDMCRLANWLPNPNRMVRSNLVNPIGSVL